MIDLPFENIQFNYYKRIKILIVFLLVLQRSNSIQTFYILKISMKVSLKNLKGEVFSVEIEAEQKIVDLKQKIRVEKGHPVESQKIIFKGKTVKDEDKIGDLGLKETDFLVVMTQVAKPQPKSKVEEKVQAPPAKVEQKKEAKQEEKKQAPKPAENQQNEAQIHQLMCMGFPREQCVAALRAAFNDSNRAVQYLLNGIPSNINQGQGGQRVQAPQGTEALQAIASLPQLQLIRQALQRDPNSLPEIMNQLALTSPEIYNLITQYPEEFERLLIDEQGQIEAEGEEGDNQEGQILVSQQEEAAINRLAALGFSKIEAAQAYIACDKNEELAANLLFDRLAYGDIESSFPGQQQNHPENDDEDDDNLFN